MRHQNFNPARDVVHVPFVHWQGLSGNWYTHSVFEPWNLPWFSEGQYNYVFVERRYDGTRIPLYVGETEGFVRRMRGHEKWESAMKLGMNEVHVHLLAPSDRIRLLIETDLRRGHRPILNDQ